MNSLSIELERWKGTPFVRHMGASARPGIGADCVSFVAHVLINIGRIKPFTWPKYVVSGGGPAMLELLEQTLSRIPELKKISGGLLEVLPMPGDVFLVSSGKALHHLAIYEGQHVLWHSTEQSKGVATANIFDPMIMRHLRSIYRVRQ